MHYDSLTTAAVADELRRAALGGRVQRVVQVDPLSLGLEIYARGQRLQLLASADPQYPRAYLVDHRLRRGVEVITPFMLLARKHLDGAWLSDVQQPPFERWLILTFGGSVGDTTLVLELIERRANVILLQGNRVLDAVQRVGPGMNRYRTILPGKPYEPPPPQAKLDPTDLTELRLRRLLEEPGVPRLVWRVLVAGVAGVSPLFAREVVYRATGNAGTRVDQCDRITPLLDAFLDALVPYWEHSWDPVVTVDEDGRVATFAPYRLTHRGAVEPMESISQALGRYYRPILGEDAYQAAKAPLREAIEQAQQRVARKRESLARQAPDPAYLEEIRKKGELVLAYATLITTGQTELEAQYDPDAPPMTIALDPRLSPVANAQRLFREYEKGKRAAAAFPRRLATSDREIAYLEQLATDLELAANWPEIDEVREALAAAGFLSSPPPARPRGAATKPLRFVSDDGFVIFVGRNSRQNELVTFRRAAPEDLWLHARGVAGGHVVIKSGGRPVPEGTLHQAARLAAGYSAARDEPDVPVDVVARKRVRRARGGEVRPGMITYVGAETVRVKPERPG